MNQEEGKKYHHAELKHEPSSKPGFLYGMQHPCLYIHLSTHQIDQNAVQETERILGIQLQKHRHVIDWLMDCLCVLQRKYHVPVTEVGVVMHRGADTDVGLIPHLKWSEEILVQLLKVIIVMYNKAVDGEDLSKTSDLQIKPYIERLQKFRSISGTGYFVDAARNNDIPFIQRMGNLFQFGYGSRSTWLDGTFTEHTPRISAFVARSKTTTAAVLRQLGIPTPTQYLVKDLDHAFKIVEQIGHPVVIKPEDTDGGLGVTNNINYAEQLRSAFNFAKEYGRSIIMEKHFEGRDYRFVVVKGQVKLTYERVPPRLVGDGVSTLHELMTRFMSKTDSRLYGTFRFMEEENFMLTIMSAGFTYASVLKENEILSLSQIPSISRGGEGIVAEDVHPDNIRLAERAAVALKLDVAGVDMLIPDITKSWLEVGAVICDVNSQPEISIEAGRSIHADILKSRVSGTGRIPTVLVLGPGLRTTALVVALQEWAQKNYHLRVGIATSEFATVNNEKITVNSDCIFKHGQTLVFDTNVDMIIVHDAYLETEKKGLPFPKFDVLIYNSLEREHVDLLRAIRMSCDGKLIDIAGDDFDGKEVLKNVTNFLLHSKSPGYG